MENRIVIFISGKKRADEIICRIDDGKIGFIDRHFIKPGKALPKAGEKWAVKIKRELDKFSIVQPLFRIDNSTPIEELLKFKEFQLKLDCFGNEFVIFEGCCKEFKRIPYDGRWGKKELHRSLSTEEILEVHRRAVSFRRRVADRDLKLSKMYGENYPDTYVFKRGEKVYGLILDPIDSSRGKRDHAFLVNYAPIVEFFPQDIEGWGMYIFETPELEKFCRERIQEGRKEKIVSVENANDLYAKFADLNADAGEWSAEDIREFLLQGEESYKKFFCGWLKIKVKPSAEKDFWKVISRLMILDYISWEVLEYEGDPVPNISKLVEMSKDEFTRNLVDLSLFKFTDPRIYREYADDEDVCKNILSFLKNIEGHSDPVPGG